MSLPNCFFLLILLIFEQTSEHDRFACLCQLRNSSFFLRGWNSKREDVYRVVKAFSARGEQTSAEQKCFIQCLVRTPSRLQYQEIVILSFHEYRLMCTVPQIGKITTIFNY